MKRARNPERSLDGRALRSERSREAIVHAMLELVGEGELSPTAERIAERAGVGLRTVFRHFDDLEGIFAAMDATLETRVLSELGEASPRGDLAARIRGLAQRRMRLFERIAPYRRSAALKRWRSPFLQERNVAMVRRLRDEMRRWLPELASAPEEIEPAAELVLSFEAWDRLRSEQRLGAARAQAVVEHALRALLGARGRR